MICEYYDSHLNIKISKSKVYIQDNKSTNGSKINDIRLIGKK